MGTEERLAHFSRIEQRKLKEGLNDLDEQSPEVREINNNLNRKHQIEERVKVMFDSKGNLKSRT